LLIKVIPDWLKPEYQRLSEQVTRGQLPHAILIHGPAGCGRRLLAFLLAQRLLGQDVDPGLIDITQSRFDDEILVHPDFQLLQPPPDKRTIPVDAVRELSRRLGFTSHQSGAQVAIITPADAMNRAAANGLLKTLEEPVANSYLLLVAEHTSRLPATVLSRCQQVRVVLPQHSDAANWLEGLKSGVNWDELLDLSAGAPLTALNLEASGFAELVHDLSADLEALSSKSKTPAKVAKDWGKHDLEPCLHWLFNRLSGELRDHFCEGGPVSGQNTGTTSLQKTGKTINMEPHFAVLRRLGELRRSQGSGLNTELHLANVLTRWYGRA